MPSGARTRGSAQSASTSVTRSSALEVPMLRRDLLDGSPDLPHGHAEELELALQVALLAGGAFRSGDGAEPGLEPVDQSFDVHPLTIRSLAARASRPSVAGADRPRRAGGAPPGSTRSRRAAWRATQISTSRPGTAIVAAGTAQISTPAKRPTDAPAKVEPPLVEPDRRKARLRDPRSGPVDPPEPTGRR